MILKTFQEFRGRDKFVAAGNFQNVHRKGSDRPRLSKRTTIQERLSDTHCSIQAAFAQELLLLCGTNFCDKTLISIFLSVG